MALDSIDHETADEGGGTSRRWVPVVATVVALAIVGLVVVLASSDPAAGPGTAATLVGQPAPGVSGTTMDGEAFDLADHRGQFVVVNFFATWCTECVVEHPELVRFSERHREAGDASVVSVAFQDDAAKIERFFDEQGGSWPVLPADTGRTVLDYGVTGVPESYVVAPDGTVIARFISGVRADELDAAIADWQGS